MLLCVYMPYECRDNEGSYLENLGTLKTIIDELDCTCRYLYLLLEIGFPISVTAHLCLEIMSDYSALRMV